MPDTSVTCLVFSKDRAAQLLALLDSMKIQCSDFLNTNISVLYRATSSVHEKQYKVVQALHPHVNFIPEVGLEADVHRVLSSTKYIAFMVDDCIVVNPFSFSDAFLLEAHTDAIGLSLRLGRNTTYCYPHRCNQKVPKFSSVGSNFLKFNWTTSEYDFGYPLELSSSIYRAKDILRLKSYFCIHTVNGFESDLYHYRELLRKEKPYLLCYDPGRAFCNPLNIVGSVAVNKNRHSEAAKYRVDCLSDNFELGLKINVVPIFDCSIVGCHQEVDLSWVPR